MIGCIRWTLRLTTTDTLVPVRFTVEHVNGDNVRGTTDSGATVICNRRSVHADRLAAVRALDAIRIAEHRHAHARG